MGKLRTFGIFSSAIARVAMDLVKLLSGKNFLNLPGNGLVYSIFSVRF